MALSIMMVSFSFVSCGSDDEPDEIKASLPSISLTKETGSSTSVMITSNVSWTASINYSGTQTGWLNMSATMGNSGTSSLTFTATSANRDDKDRVATIQFVGGDAFETITVTQKGNEYDSGLDIQVKDVVVMANSIAFKHSFGSKISYFYSGYLNASAAGWTDEKIAQTLSSQFDAQQPDDGIISCEDLSPSTTYLLCAVGYDKLGNQGRVMKQSVTTAKYKNNRPSVTIDDVYVDESSNWCWSTTIGAYCTKYYMIAESGDYATYYALCCDAFIAWMIQDAINSDELDPIVQGGSWYMSKPSSDKAFYCAAWAVGANNDYATELDVFYGTLNGAKSRVAAQARPASNPSITHHSYKDAKQMFKNVIKKMY